MKVALPWMVAAGTIAFSVYLYLGDPAPENPMGQAKSPSNSQRVSEIPAQSSRRREPSEPLAAVPVKRAEANKTPSTPPADNLSLPRKCPPRQLCPICPPPPHDQCADMSELKSCKEKVAECRAWDPVVTEAVDRQSLDAARQATLKFLLQDDLQLSAPKVQWLSEAACALRELRWYAVEQMHVEDLAIETPRLQIMGDRNEILSDMKELLGTDTYARFREMGGIGLLNDTLECADQPSGP